MKRAPKLDPKARCCWICGKLGGNGATTALRMAGYDVPKDHVAHAHPACLRKALLKQRRGD